MTRLLISLVFLSVFVYAQSDRGTVTGTVADPAGAVVPSAPIDLENTETGAKFQAASSSTGNFTLAQLPAGAYRLSVVVPGFKRFAQENIRVQVGQTVRIDVVLEVGSNAESITVTTEVSLLKTEDGALTHTISAQKLNDLPVLGIGGNFSSSNGLRFYMAQAQLVPGTYFQVSSLGTATIKVNGAPSGTQRTMVDGMDATNTLNGVPASMQPSVDAIQETTILVSDYSAEFGQVGGGLFNITMKSGTNRYHGSGFDYLQNEALNAATPFINKLNRVRRNDYGGSFGGPIRIPKIYNGKDKSFFFFNFEEYRELGTANTVNTVPTVAYRSGDFSGNLGAGVVSNTTFPSPLTPAVAVPNGAIYDPTTTATAPNGQKYRLQFPGNIVPVTSFDPVALKIQNMMPLPTNTQKTLNQAVNFPVDRLTPNVSIKLDHQIRTNSKISGYFGSNKTSAQYSTNLNGSEGFPGPLTATRGTFTHSFTYRINYDQTLSPTMLFHLGAGLVNYPFSDHAPYTNYDQVKELGLTGAAINGAGGGRFPSIATTVAANGGMQAMGAGLGGTQTESRELIPTFNTSLNWVRGNHTIKFGGEFRINSWTTLNLTATNGAYNFSTAQTSQPYFGQAPTGAATAGFAYASFLLGQVNQVQINDPANIRMAKQQWGLFVQDNWKVTRKLTLDYGLRWDYSQTPREQYGRLPTLAPTLPNAVAGGHLGATQFEATCKCTFSKNYPAAFGPRIGVAYQLSQKTVLRAGFGISYTGTGSNANGSVNPANTILNPEYGFSTNKFGNGIPAAFRKGFPNLDNNAFPTASNPLLGPPIVVDQNGGRPARQMQWSAGLQHEVFRNLVVDVSYVGNRGVWWPSTNLVNYNGMTLGALTAAGISLTSATDRTLMTQQVTSTAAGRFFNRLPYAGFRGSVLQSLLPFPQFGSGLAPQWAPIGQTWYDSLQAKVTKRLSHGLDLTYAFTYAKELQNGTGGNLVDVFNRDTNKSLSTLSRPLVSVFSANYTTPKWTMNRVTSLVTGDWMLGTVLQYGSGLPIAAPTATTNNGLSAFTGRSTTFQRVAGQPLFLKDLNCHCVDPNRDLVLNPAAWVDPPIGQYAGQAVYYNDYRSQRRPSESMSLARNFRFKESMNLMIRGEFSNIFNRTQMNDAGTTTNPTTTVTCSAGAAGSATCNDPATRGTLLGGFGYISPASVAASSRNGTIVARFTF
jgi:outer membrane receptor protein involved in Fe transport